MAAVIRGDVPTVGDYRAFALKRAQQLGVFQSAPAVFDDDCTRAPTTSGSLFQATAGAGTVAVLPGDGGGAWRLTSSGASGGTQFTAAGAGNVGTGVKPGMTGDPATSGTRWYLFAVFRMSTAVDNKTAAYIGIRPADNTTGNVLFFGVAGQFVSTTKLMAEENVLNTQASTVDIGSTTTWHYLEAWQVGTANAVKFSFDGEAALTLTTTAAFSTKGTLFASVTNGTTLVARSFDVDHITLRMPPNVTLPSI